MLVFAFDMPPFICGWGKREEREGEREEKERERELHPAAFFSPVFLIDRFASITPKQWKKEKERGKKIQYDKGRERMRERERERENCQSISGPKQAIHACMVASFPRAKSLACGSKTFYHGNKVLLYHCMQCQHSNLRQKLM